MAARPEISSDGRADAYYKDKSKSYHAGTKNIQDDLTDVAIEHFHSLRRATSQNNAKPLVLDLGCGTALSSYRFLEQTGLPLCIGCDISQEMLRTGQDANALSKVDRVLADFNRKLPFRDGAFDFVLSISAMQWIITEREGDGARKDDGSQSEVARAATEAQNEKSCDRFFSDLVRIGASGVLQFYPPRAQPSLVGSCFQRHIGRYAKHSSIITEYPHKEAKKKYFLTFSRASIPDLTCYGEGNAGRPWCALCWPVCDSVCRLSLVPDATLQEMSGKQFTRSKQAFVARPDQDANCSSFSVVRSIKEHEDTFKRYLRNAIRLVSLERDLKSATGDNQAAGASLRNAQAQLERIDKELGVCGKHVALHLHAALVARRKAREANDDRNSEGRTLSRSPRRQASAPPSYSAQELLDGVSALEKIKLLHECPHAKLSDAPREWVENI